MRWPWSKAQPAPARKALDIKGPLAELLRLSSTSIQSGNPSAALELYEQSSAVYTPVSKIVDLFAGLRPVLEVKGEAVAAHPLLDLLQSPSPYMDAVLWRQALASDYLLTHEAYVIAVGTQSSAPAELQVISPRSVSMIEDQETRTVGAYQLIDCPMPGQYIRVPQGRAVRYRDGTLRELIPVRGYSVRNNAMLRGQSPLVAASAEVRQHILGTKHNVSLLEKGGRVSLIFHFSEDMDQEDFDALRDRVQEQYAGASNAGQIGVTSGGKLDIKEIGVNNKDMDFANLQQAARLSVAMAYKVPLPLVTTDAATFSNYTSALVALYDDAVLPLADKLYGALGAALLPRYKLDPKDSRITYDIMSIPALRTRALTEAKLRMEIGVETDNEIRSVISREPYAGGDIVLKPATLIPAGRDTDTDNAPIV